MKQLIFSCLALALLVAATIARSDSITFTNSGTVGGVPITVTTTISTATNGALLLEDGASFLLLEDNSSPLCLEGGC